MSAERDAYHELCTYSLGLGDAAFLHQHVVDAHAAQVADGIGPPIRLAFALIGLYLHVERGLTGRQVQLAHITLARRRRGWPAFPSPTDRGAITALDVLDAPEGPARDAMIRAWAASAWGPYRHCRGEIEALLAECRFAVGGCSHAGSISRGSMLKTRAGNDSIRRGSLTSRSPGGGRVWVRFARRRGEALGLSGSGSGGR